MSTVAEKPKPTSLANRMDTPADMREAGTISVTDNGLVLTSMNQAIEFAKLMSRMGEAIPKHLRDKAGPCLAVCIQAFEWRISPLALANKTYVVNDRLCYEAALYQSVVARRAPIRGRIKMEYEGEGNNRTCRVWAELADETGEVDYTSPKFGVINPKNSPLWKNDPDQQLFYFSVRGFARRHFNDVMMGIYTVDEMQDTTEFSRTIDVRSKADRLADRLIGNGTATESQDAATEELLPSSTADADDRRKTESTKSQTKHDNLPPVECRDVGGSFAEQIEDAMSLAALDKINQEFTAAHGRKEIDGTRLDELLGLYQERKKQLA